MGSVSGSNGSRHPEYSSRVTDRMKCGTGRRIRGTRCNDIVVWLVHRCLPNMKRRYVRTFNCEFSIEAVTFSCGIISRSRCEPTPSIDESMYRSRPGPVDGVEPCAIRSARSIRRYSAGRSGGLVRYQQHRGVSHVDQRQAVAHSTVTLVDLVQQKVSWTRRMAPPDATANVYVVACRFHGDSVYALAMANNAGRVHVVKYGRNGDELGHAAIPVPTESRVARPMSATARPRTSGRRSGSRKTVRARIPWAVSP